MELYKEEEILIETLRKACVSPATVLSDYIQVKLNNNGGQWNGMLHDLDEGLGEMIKNRLDKN